MTDQKSEYIVLLTAQCAGKRALMDCAGESPSVFAE